MPERVPVMNEPGRVLRPARPDDARDLAELVDHAGEGLPRYLWGTMAGPGQSPWDVGVERARREQGAFSYRNALLIEHGGRVAGCLIGYGIDAPLEPVPDDIPPMFRPLQELENLAPATWYVNVLAVHPPYRGLGLGTRLLAEADARAGAEGRYGTSLIVADANRGARRLYERLGYRERATRPMVKEGWRNAGRDWVLMVRERAA